MPLWQSSFLGSAHCRRSLRGMRCRRAGAPQRSFGSTGVREGLIAHRGGACSRAVASRYSGGGDWDGYTICAITGA